MKAQFLSKVLVEIHKLSPKFKSSILSLHDLNTITKDRIDLLVQENDILITNFLPDEINNSLNLKTHKSLSEKLLFCPFLEPINLDIKSNLRKEKTLFFCEQSTLIDEESKVIRFIIKSLSKNENYDLSIINKNESFEKINEKISRSNHVYIYANDLTLSTQLYVTSLAYNKSVNFISNPNFSPFRFLLLGIPFPNIIRYNKSNPLRFFVNQIFKTNESSPEQNINENIPCFNSFSNPKDFISYTQSEFYKFSYKSIYLEDESNLKPLWFSLSDKKQLEPTSSAIDFENNKYFRKSCFNFISSNLYDLSAKKEANKNILRYMLKTTDCWTTKKHIVDIVIKYPKLRLELCSNMSKIGINENDLCRSNFVSHCIDFLFKFLEDKDHRVELAEDWTNMVLQDKKEGLSHINAKQFEYLLPTILSLKDIVPEAIVKHQENFSTHSLVKFLAVHARWSENHIFEEVLTQSSKKINDKIINELVFNQLMTPFTTYFISAPSVFKIESEKWLNILLNDLDISSINPRTSLLFLMNQIITKNDILEFLIPVTEKLIQFSPYAINTICYGLWWNGMKDEIKIIKSRFQEFFSIKCDDIDIHSKIIFIITGLLECNKNFLDNLADQQLPVEIPDNFYKFFNLGILNSKIGNNSDSNRFFEIANELNPFTYSKIIANIPNC